MAIRFEPVTPDQKPKGIEIVATPIEPAAQPRTKPGRKPKPGGPTFDKKTYQRNLMRERRAADKAKAALNS